MAAFSPKIAPKHNTKICYPSIAAVTAEMGGFSMIGGTMPRMSKKRRLEWAFFLNERNRITFNALCRGCTHSCKQSFRAVIILCPRYYSKRRKKEDRDNGR